VIYYKIEPHYEIWYSATWQHVEHFTWYRAYIFFNYFYFPESVSRASVFKIYIHIHLINNFSSSLILLLPFVRRINATHSMFNIALYLTRNSLSLTPRFDSGNKTNIYIYIYMYTQFLTIVCIKNIKLCSIWSFPNDETDKLNIIYNQLQSIL